MTDAARNIEWRAADRSTRRELHGFTCTTPKVYDPATQRPSHPREFEFEVQSRLRSLKVPVKAPCYCLAGYLDGELACLAYFERREGGDPPYFLIHATAVAQRFQGQGLGTETMRTVIDEICSLALEAGASGVRIEAMVHPRNFASQQKNSRAGLVRDADADFRGYQSWRADIEFPRANS